MVLALLGRLYELVDHAVGRRDVRVAEPEIDDVHAARRAASLRSFTSANTYGGRLSMRRNCMPQR